MRFRWWWCSDGTPLECFARVVDHLVVRRQQVVADDPRVGHVQAVDGQLEGARILVGGDGRKSNASRVMLLSVR